MNLDAETKFDDSKWLLSYIKPFVQKKFCKKKESQNLFFGSAILTSIGFMNP